MRQTLLIIIALNFIAVPNSIHAEDILLSSIQRERDGIEVVRPQADLVVIDKSSKRMTLYKDRRPIRIYKVALGRTKGAKIRQGDRRTPEGFYTIDGRNPESEFHLALHISYPNKRDREIAGLLGVSAGGGIMIHGVGEEYEWMGRYHTVSNWTDGCIAVTNQEIEEIWKLVPDGTEVQIKP